MIIYCQFYLNSYYYIGTYVKTHFIYMYDGKWKREATFQKSTFIVNIHKRN
jgi:hypothetical protein